MRNALRVKLGAKGIAEWEIATIGTLWMLFN